MKRTHEHHQIEPSAARSAEMERRKRGRRVRGEQRYAAPRIGHDRIVDALRFCALAGIGIRHARVGAQRFRGHDGRHFVKTESRTCRRLARCCFVYFTWRSRLKLYTWRIVALKSSRPLGRRKRWPNSLRSAGGRPNSTDFGENATLNVIPHLSAKAGKREFKRPGLSEV